MVPSHSSGFPLQVLVEWSAINSLTTSADACYPASHFPLLWTSLSWNNTDKKRLSKTITPNRIFRGYDWLKVHRTSLLPLPHSPDSYSLCQPSLKRNSSSFSSYFVAVIPISGRPCIVSSHSCRGLTEYTLPHVSASLWNSGPSTGTV